MNAQAVAVKKKPRKRRQCTDPLEKKIQWDMVKNLRTMGFFVTTFSQPQRAMMTAGVPDVLAMHRGWPGRVTVIRDGWEVEPRPLTGPLHVWIEVKRPGKHPTTAQIVWHSLAREHGANVIVAHNLTELLAGLKALGAPLT